MTVKSSIVKITSYFALYNEINYILVLLIILIMRGCIVDADNYKRVRVT